jgi:cyclopropane fatty-acyl-phospholipid synthase-like methyltransferase
MKKNDIINYYNKTKKDYEWIWGLKNNHALHYGYYDVAHQSHKKAAARLNEIVAEVACITSTDKVLDAGCGVGGSSVWLGQNKKCKVYGISLVQSQIYESELLAKKKKVDDLVTFSAGDYCHTVFDDESISVVWGIESICHTETKLLFIQEAWRVLEKGGRIVVADFFLDKKPGSAMEKKYINTWIDGWAIPNLSSVEEFKKDLEQTGFKNVSCINVTKNILPSSKRMYYYSIFTFPFAKVMQFLGLRTKTEMKNSMAAYYQYAALKRELWTYGIFYAEKS